MTWARFDDQMAFHAKILAAGNEPTGAWARMIAHCCAHLTDGKVPRSVALSITTPKVLAKLITVRLLDADGEDFAVHDFLDWNPPSEEVKAKRLTDKLRKEASRKGQGRGSDGRIKSATCPPGQAVAVQTESEIRPPVPSPVSRLPSPVPIQSHTQIPSPPDENPEWGLLDSKTPEIAEPPREQQYQAAYEAGVEEVTGNAFAMPEKQRGELHQAMTKHARSREGVAFRGEKLLAWIRFHAAEHARFIAALPADRRQYWPPGPRSMLRWLNENPPVEHPASGVHAVTPTERRVAGLFQAKAVPR